mgnify:CR=1 FL=1
MQVIQKKTARLLSACTEIGAISADASDEMVKKCREFGEYLGYCFYFLPFSLGIVIINLKVGIQMNEKLKSLGIPSDIITKLKEQL